MTSRISKAVIVLDYFCDLLTWLLLALALLLIFCPSLPAQTLATFYNFNGKAGGGRRDSGVVLALSNYGPGTR